MNLEQLVTELRYLDQSLRSHVAQSANVGLTLRNWLVGAYIIEFEQNGEDRATYGENLIPKIAAKLAIKGLSSRNLEASRLLYQSYSGISQTVSAILAALSVRIPQTLSADSDNQSISNDLEIHQLPSGAVQNPKFSRPDFAPPVEQLFQKLTFSHFVELLRISDPLQRAFYEIECVKGG